MKEMERDCQVRVSKQSTKSTYWLETEEGNRMGSDEGIQTINKVHVLAGGRWRKLDGWEVFKRLTKFTYYLETDEGNEMGWSDEGIQAIDKIHILAGDGWRKWDGMIRWGVLKQLTKFTYWLETDQGNGIGWSDKGIQKIDQFTYFLKTEEEGRVIRWEVFKQLTKFTYSLETEEADGIGWSDGGYSINLQSTRTAWKRMKGMG